MGLIRIDRNPAPRQLALFGLIWLVFFGVVGAVVLGQTDSVAWAVVLWVLAVAVPLLGWLVPAFMRIVYLGMSYAAFPIGFVLSHVILAAVYYLVLTPVGLLMRPFGYDPMHRRFDPQAKSYWAPRQQDEDVQRYFRQF